MRGSRPSTLFLRDKNARESGHPPSATIRAPWAAQRARVARCHKGFSARRITMTVPRLITALAGPLPDLERQLIASQAGIEHWLRSQWQDHAAPFYCSVDPRNSGFKLGPVDT